MISDGTDTDTDILFISVSVFYGADISDIGQIGRYAYRYVEIVNFLLILLIFIFKKMK